MKPQVTLRAAQDLAYALGITPELLEHLVANKNSYYKHAAIPKRATRTGQKKSAYPELLRHLHIPSQALMIIQQWILTRILYTRQVSDHATAYVPGRGLLDNVSPHVGGKYFLCMDIANFFGSINISMVTSLFESFGYVPQISKLLAELCTVYDFLPQGGPSSPAISNLIMRDFDSTMIQLCGNGIAYTRYADDLTFSSKSKTRLKEMIPLVDSQINKHGFRVNWRKFHMVGPRRQCKITGLIKDVAGRRFGVGKDAKRRMRSIMLAAAQNTFNDRQYDSLNSIEGWLAYLKSVDINGFKQMSDYWDRVRAKFRTPKTTEKTDAEIKRNTIPDATMVVDDVFLRHAEEYFLHIYQPIYGDRVTRTLSLDELIKAASRISRMNVTTMHVFYNPASSSKIVRTHVLGMLANDGNDLHGMPIQIAPKTVDALKLRSQALGSSRLATFHSCESVAANASVFVDNTSRVVLLADDPAYSSVSGRTDTILLRRSNRTTNMPGDVRWQNISYLFCLAHGVPC